MLERNDLKTQLDAALAKVTEIANKQAGFEKTINDRAAERDAAQLDALRLRVAGASGLPLDLAERLSGKSEEELKADAAKLAAFVKPPTPGVPPAPPGAPPPALDVTRMTPDEIRQNAAKLWPRK